MSDTGRRRIKFACMLGVLLLLSWLGRFVFIAEETEFDKRAYGYFASLQPAGATTPLPSVSGMVRFDASSYLVVHDTKADSDAVPRIGLLRLLETGRMTYSPIALADVGVNVPPMDVEALAAVPHRPQEYLMVESARFKKRPMRLFHIKVVYREDRALAARLLRVVRLPDTIENCEGAVCLQASDESFLLLLSERGGSEKNPDGKLLWGPLNLETGTFRSVGETKLQLPKYVRQQGARACSDLFIDDSNVLWASGGFDPDDGGPFWSVVYQVGSVTGDPRTPIKMHKKPEVCWRVDGFKIEALAASIIPGAVMCFATDDEDYGGVWRPLPKRAQQQAASAPSRRNP